MLSWDFIFFNLLDVDCSVVLLKFFSGDLMYLNNYYRTSEQRKWLNDPEGISPGDSFYIIK